MKITLINHSDTLGGASVVTFRLMEALRAEGVDARMLVMSKSGNSPYVEQAAPKWRSDLSFIAEHLEILCRNGFSRANLFKASIATGGLPLSRHKLVREADVVVLNWVNQGMLSLDEVGRIAAHKPTLWTMHDMWNITGICHHAGQCDRFRSGCHLCPLLGNCAGPKDLSHSCFNRKLRLYSTHNLTFVSVSSWLTDKAKKSALMREQQVVTIPVAFPVERYAKVPTMSRAQLGLPEGKKLIVMCAARLDDPIKGLPVAIEALNGLLPDAGNDAAAVFIGAIRNPHALDRLCFPYITLGLAGDEMVRSTMGHASVVMSSSSYESFGATLLEGQAAGAVPVAFTHDGRADIIEDGITGYSAGLDSTDASALTKALAKALTTPLPTLQRAAQKFSYKTVAQKYLEIIQSGIKNESP